MAYPGVGCLTVIRIPTQSDIRSFYDELKPVKLLEWLLRVQAPIDLAISAIRLQLAPTVVLRCGSEQISFVLELLTR